MLYEEAISDITSKGKFYINLGLDRISRILDILGNPQDSLKCIQVAGTNGKGSVCSMLYSILQEAGYKTGIYTSPHIFDYTERIGIDGNNISKKDFSKYYEMIVNIADENSIRLTEFEILTVIMFKYFYDNNIDIAIIETGLGGRFDATNVLKTNLAAIITHIDLDHTERLGDTKEKIAFEKAGIIKPDSVVFAMEGYEVFKDRADELNALFVLTLPFVDFEYIDCLSLKGMHQQENLSLVLTAIKYLFSDISDDIIKNGLNKVKNPCRFQYIKDKNLIVDGAHNPNCFKVLRANLDKFYPNVKKQYIFGCLKNKKYKEMIGYIEEDALLERIYFYEFNNKNACSYDDIKKVCSKNIIALKDKDSIKYSEDILTVICGSFYMINELIDKETIFLK